MMTILGEGESFYYVHPTPRAEPKILGPLCTFIPSTHSHQIRHNISRAEACFKGSARYQPQGWDNSAHKMEENFGVDHAHPRGGVPEAQILGVLPYIMRMWYNTVSKFCIVTKLEQHVYFGG